MTALEVPDDLDDDPRLWTGESMMTAPTPTVCPRCDGEGIVPAPDDVSEFWFPCPDCRCMTCGEPTSTPPLCPDCGDDIGDRVYERSHDV